MTQEQIVDRAREVLAFLDGRGPLDGLWFGDRDKRGRAFWWRKHLAEIEAALSQQEQKA